jgi:hypothetical protein
MTSKIGRLKLSKTNVDGTTMAIGRKKSEIDVEFSSISKQHHSVPFSNCGVDLSGELIPDTVYLEFTLHSQSNNLTYEGNGVSKRQEALHKLISYMNDYEGISFRKISAWLNRSGIKTHRGKTWSETGSHAHSILKRMREREERIAKLRKARFSTSISKLSLSRF